VFFDDASAAQYRDGVIRLTLEAERLFPGAGPQEVVTDRVIAAHLRMSLPAAYRLKAVLDRLIALMDESRRKVQN
jgi:hypothetical protein